MFPRSTHHSRNVSTWQIFLAGQYLRPVSSAVWKNRVPEQQPDNSFSTVQVAGRENLTVAVSQFMFLGAFR